MTRAGELREFVSIERANAAGEWAGYAEARAMVVDAGGDGEEKSWQVLTRWTPELARLAGLRELNQGWRVVWDDHGILRYLVIVSTQADEKRRELRLLCRELPQEPQDED